MRVRITTNPPLPPLKAWFPISLPSQARAPTVSSFKSLLCVSLPALSRVSSSSLHLSIDGFELLDGSELTIVRDGDLICIDTLPENASVHPGQAIDQGSSWGGHALFKPAASRKRRRSVLTSSSSGSESDDESDTETTTSTSTSESESSDSDSTSDSDDSSRTTPSLRKEKLSEHVPAVQHRSRVVSSAKLVPPGYGKPQTRSRNLRRRVKRMHEREAAGAPANDGPVSGANATMTGRKAIPPAAAEVSQSAPVLMSLSLRNKNKAKNLRSLMSRPLPPKIIFEDQEGEGSPSASGMIEKAEAESSTTVASRQALPRLIPPSSRSSLPSNLFVTSVDVEAGLRRDKKKRKMRDEYGDEGKEASANVEETITLDYGESVEATTAPAYESEAEISRLESIANERWATLVKLTNQEQITPRIIIGYKALGIDPVSYTPEQLLVVGRVLSCDEHSVWIRPMRGQVVSFSGPVDAETAGEEHTWDAIRLGDWRIV